MFVIRTSRHNYHQGLSFQINEITFSHSRNRCYANHRNYHMLPHYCWCLETLVKGYMILLITKYFETLDTYGFPTGEKELLVDYGIDLETDQTIVLPNIHPKEIGGEFDKTYNEYILE
jgi:hypothetical protein